MSNNLTKRSVVVGLALTLGSSVFGALPASADTNSVTLVPTAGSTFNTIIGSNATLSATLDPALEKGDPGNTAAPDYENAYFVISNPDAAPLSISFDTDIEQSATGSISREIISFDADGDGTVHSIGSGSGNVASEAVFYKDSRSDGIGTDGTFIEEITSSATRFAISATALDATNDTFRLANIGIDFQSTATESAAITVQLLVDNAAIGTSQIGRTTQLDSIVLAPSVKLTYICRETFRPTSLRRELEEKKI